MCLSKVIVKVEGGEEVVAQEASSIHETGGHVEIQTLFGEKKVLSGYAIKEVNLLKNYVVLAGTGVRP